MATAREGSSGQQAEREAGSPSSAATPPETINETASSAPERRALPPVGQPAELDPAALRALAHPLRIRILDLLSGHGPLTASKLGEIVSESSGSTSYHLRQLAKHGLVQEVKGKGTARERWWERTPGGFSISGTGKDSPASRQTAAAVNVEFLRLRHERMTALIRSGEGADEATLAAMLETTAFMTTNVSATPEQIKAVMRAWERFMAEEIEPLRGQEDLPGVERFEIHFDVFRTVDPEAMPD